MKKYLVIGNPIEHSLSPTLHNYWIKNNGIDATYDKKKLNENELEQIISQVKEKKIDGIYLECYQDLAHKQLAKIRNQAIQQWQLTECNIIHRIGSLGLGEKIVLVITSSKHRANSISACEYVIDNLKANVAFWKFNIFGKNQEAVESKKKDLDKFLQWSNIVKTN